MEPEAPVQSPRVRGFFLRKQPADGCSGLKVATRIATRSEERR